MLPICSHTCVQRQRPQNYLWMCSCLQEMMSSRMAKPKQSYQEDCCKVIQLWPLAALWGWWGGCGCFCVHDAWCLMPECLKDRFSCRAACLSPATGRRPDTVVISSSSLISLVDHCVCVSYHHVEFFVKEEQFAFSKRSTSDVKFSEGMALHIQRSICSFRTLATQRNANLFRTVSTKVMSRLKLWGILLVSSVVTLVSLVQVYDDRDGGNNGDGWKRHEKWLLSVTSISIGLSFFGALTTFLPPAKSLALERPLVRLSSLL